ncbi:MAG: 50S ribosomal protein L4, partial [Actinobacteria bacterium]|nr:50S ribosomal protein L4 [Actinomycetota bacterium]
LEPPSTRACVEILDDLKLKGHIMVVVSEDDLNVEKSFRNIPNVETYLTSELNTYDILRFDRLLFLKGALDVLQGEGGNEVSA